MKAPFLFQFWKDYRTLDYQGFLIFYKKLFILSWSIVNEQLLLVSGV